MRFLDLFRKNKKRKGGYRRLAVGQYKNGKLIAKYNSISEAGDKTGHSKGHISECCNGIRKYANGYQWKFLDE